MGNKALFIVLSFLLLLAPPLASIGETWEEIRIDPVLQEEMNTNGAAGYMIMFRGRPDLTRASTLGWGDRGVFVAESLEAGAAWAQRRVREYLDGRGASYASFWIANVIVVDYSDRATFEELRRFPEIASLERRRSVPLPDIQEEVSVNTAVEGIEANISYVKADQVWAMGYHGGGIVVANIDGGVRFSHKALVGQYRGNLGSSFDHNYNWFDPTKRCTDSPCDDADHGTHTMGTIVGNDGAGNRIGVAPGARWIACKACGARDCPDAALLACGQFILAPTDVRGNNPDPSKRPRVVNNSVGRAGGDPWYQQVVDNWQAAGIYPVFANGNGGPRCGTVDTPGDYGNVTAVGNVDHRTGLPWETSARGPGIFKKTINPMGYPYLKPQVSAPGVAIRSSIASGDDAYKELTGTSMATPHVAGLIALMLQAAPCLDYAELERIVIETANPIMFPSGCGDEGPGGLPNNATGWGMIDALKAVGTVFGRCGKMGMLEGTVTSRGKPLAGATVTTSTRLTTTTDEGGHYLFPHIPEGTHTVTVGAFGFYDSTSAVNVPADGSAAVGFDLHPKGSVTVRGKVTDGSGVGWPLYASADIFSPGFAAKVWTDPFTGRYVLTLYKDTPYTFTVSSRGYDSEQRTVEASGISVRQDFILKADRTCTAPGYEDIRILSEEFEGVFPPPGWTATVLSGTTNFWRRNDYFRRPNMTGGSGFCADADSEATCYQSKWDAALTCPPLAISAGTRATLYYRSGFFQFGPGATAWLDASTDGGLTWQPLTQRIWGESATGEVVDLSPLAGTSSLLRWRYVSGYCDYYWQIDDVKVVTGCRPRDGGLVAGRVLDANTRRPLAGVTVTGDGGAAATTNDDGVYVLFADKGVRMVTAIPPAGYGSAEVSVQVLSSQVARKNLALTAGRILAGPKALSVTVGAGSKARRVVMLRNSGTAPVSLNIDGTTSWLLLSPASGGLSVGASKPITAVFDARELAVGVYSTSLHVRGNTPYAVLSIPVTMTVVKEAAEWR